MNLALGAVYAWSIFIRPPEEEFGWTRADSSSVFTIVIFVFGITFVPGGRTQDKLGPTVWGVMDRLAESGLQPHQAIAEASDLADLIHRTPERKLGPP